MDFYVLVADGAALAYRAIQTRDRDQLAFWPGGLVAF
jgi:hypothetical protein